ncbi:MAG: hypothetical protein ABS910_03110 [Arthrobacter sp.]
MNSTSGSTGLQLGPSPQDPTAPTANWSGYPVEPWPQKLRWAAPNLIMLGILTAVVQVFIEQVQTFRLRMDR